VTLELPAPDEALHIGGLLACRDPWARLGIDADTIARQFVPGSPAAYPFAIRSGGCVVGGVLVRHPWLLGPYLNLVGIHPSARRKGIGAAVLGWLEGEAQRAGTRNIWLCVSAFNADAQHFYRRHGYREVATLDDLVVPGEDEVLMRKRLEPASVEGVEPVADT
jgi:GNAT superfamily N-acetyltransferase